MRAGIVGSIGKRYPGLNGIKILSRDPRESIGKSVLLFPFFYAFFWSAYYDCQKKTNGKQKINKRLEIFLSFVTTPLTRELNQSTTSVLIQMTVKRLVLTNVKAVSSKIVI